jgi:hypothetical protein
MRKWLAIAAVSALTVSTGAMAQSSGTLVATHATTRALDLRLSQEIGGTRPAPLIRSMVLRQDIAPNATFGIGLANIYAKRKGSADLRIGDPTPHSRKPAVTFILKF